jgi:anti-sigma B factor antagonist
MEIYAQDNQDGTLITVDNDKLIGVESEAFQNVVQNSIEKGSKNISIDLSKVEYISSWGIGLLVHAYTSCHNKNIAFKLQGVNSQVMNVLNQLKLTTLFNIT